MALPDHVKHTQRRIATLDGVYRRALAGLEAAQDRRAEVLADADRHVQVARDRAEAAVADMARQLSVPLAAELVDMPIREVRRILRAHPVPADERAEL